MFLRLIKLLIRTNRNLEDARVALSCHKTFTLEDSFALFDINKNGRIAFNELTMVFEENGIQVQDIPRLIEIVDTDQDGTIELDEWQAALAPKSLYRRTDPNEPYLSVEEKNLFQRAWLEQLAHVFSLLIQTDIEVNEKRSQLMLNGERLFDEMDSHNLGYISINSFANWVAESCGFYICDEDLPALEFALDGQSDYRITRQEFIDTVSVYEEEDGDE